MQKSYKPRFHRPCTPPLWLRGNIIASHLADPGSILGPISFLGLSFYWIFPQLEDKCREIL